MLKYENMGGNDTFQFQNDNYGQHAKEMACNRIHKVAQKGFWSKPLFYVFP